ncbi:MAG: XRE family transcriptional regulator [Alphaproteobacteria bacterium]|nr:XRE family transcriptional regulator [Alphaproteobacteria bacterium]
MRNKIRQFRKQRGLTLAGLGTAIGLTPQSVSRIENGKMRLSTGWMEKIAAALNVSPVDLLDAGPPGGSELIGEIGEDGYCQSAPPQPFRLTLPGPDSRVVRLAQPCGPYRAGEYLVCVRLPRARHEMALGHDCLVELTDGARHLCRVVSRAISQRRGETFTLSGLASGSWVRSEQPVAWLAPVRMRLQFTG